MHLAHKNQIRDYLANRIYNELSVYRLDQHMPLKQDERQSVPQWLASLDLVGPDPLIHISFPLKEVLDRSLYYPACEFDGGPVQLLGGFVHSFVYVDYGVGQGALQAAVQAAGFKGYRLAGRKTLGQSDLAPRGWYPTIPHQFRSDADRFQRVSDDWVRPPFAEWMVFERNPEFDDAHGPARFSLLYIGADGVAAYQALYVGNNCAPRVLAIIQPGTGFGGNYTEFRDADGFLAHVVLQMNKSLPCYMMCGMNRARPTTAFWPDVYPKSVENWYNLGIWSRVDPPAVNSDLAAQ